MAMHEFEMRDFWKLGAFTAKSDYQDCEARKDFKNEQIERSTKKTKIWHFVASSQVSGCGELVVGNG